MSGPHSRVIFLPGMKAQHAPVDGSNHAERQTSAEELVEMVRRAQSGRGLVREMQRQEWPAEETASAETRVDYTRARSAENCLPKAGQWRSAAGFLGLSVKTVDAHKFNLMRKLGIHNKAELVMWAIQKRGGEASGEFLAISES